MEGTPRSNIGVSEIRTTSDLSRSLLAATKRSKFSLPTSSSPSMRNFTFTGRRPVCLRCASTEAK